MSNRKPYNDTAGYVAGRVCHASCGGHIVIIDRENGGDWIDADYRWVVVHFPSTLHVSIPSRRDAYDYMKGAAEGRYTEILPEPGA